jgi:Holliday junction resolvase-like predicted endonuclease
MQVRRLARAWLAENLPPRYRSIRFDVVGVSLDSGRAAAVEHLPGAF